MCYKPSWEEKVQKNAIFAIFCLSIQYLHSTGTNECRCRRKMKTNSKSVHIVAPSPNLITAQHANFCAANGKANLLVCIKKKKTSNRNVNLEKKIQRKPIPLHDMVFRYNADVKNCNGNPS